ncbi:DEAD-box ATP-dependent RNA helicase 7-like [Sesbania bispinosa]|nr:DEAD-box ATP-dependent RNA helicase 7-like [Sesbania bispinosa]
MGLTSCSLYGGTPYHSQEFKLKRVVDIVVGTPGCKKKKCREGWKGGAWEGL